MNLKELQESWSDTPEYHKHTHESFVEIVNAVNLLKTHRDYVESNIWGFGERSFWWLWQLVCDGLPEKPSMLEIGVFRSATMSLWKLLRPDAYVFGITPLDTSGDMWESDYAADIAKIHDDFRLAHPTIFIGRSDNPDVIEKAGQILYDLVYVDGSHTYIDSLGDIVTYSPMIKEGGLLVIDDCNCNLNFPPSGFFTGIADVTQAKIDWLAKNPPFEFICSCVHISVFQRI